MIWIPRHFVGSIREGKSEMLRSMVHKSGEHFAHNPAKRGYNAVYRQHETNYCPGCGRTHWYVGRISAECGFCGTALPFAELEYSWGGRRPAWRTCTAQAS